MGMVITQHEFVGDVIKLITFAHEQGFMVTFGEAYRPIEMQEIYVRTGRSKTMNSYHLKRLGLDLNFFKAEEGRLRLTYNKEELQPIGDYWEGLRPGRNRWGGNFKKFKDVPHFERRNL